MMKTNVCSEDVVVRLSPTHMVMSESGMTLVGSLGAGAWGAGVGGRVSAGAAGGAGGALECGRRLLAAARGGDTPTVRRLMAMGAPFTTDWLGTTPLHLAAGAGHADTLAALLAAGVSRDARTKVDRTALHLAATHGHAACVAALIGAGAVVDARDLLRMTPLHWAVERGHVAVAVLLLAAGADPHAESKFRKTPLGLARARAGVGAGAGIGAGAGTGAGEGTGTGAGELLRLMEECVKEREAKRSVDAIVGGTGAEEADDIITLSPEAKTCRIQQITELPAQEPPPPPPPRTKLTHKRILLNSTKFNSNINGEGGSGGAGSGGGEGEDGGAGGAEGEAGSETGAAALLRRHGITLLPADDGDGGTLLSALHSGRSIVLSDAGKLMLKESGAMVVRAQPTAGAGAAPRARPAPVAPPASPSRPPPAPPAAKPPSSPVTPSPQKQDLKQVKLVQLGDASDGKNGTKGRGGAGGAGAGTGATRPSVRIIMNRHNFRKLIATATRASGSDKGMLTEEDLELESDSEGEGAEGDSERGRRRGESVVTVPEQFVRSGSAQYLRSQLLCAHAAIHHLARRLRLARTKLKRLRAATGTSTPTPTGPH